MIAANRLSGKLITLEGLDGAGKSTQLKLFEDYLKVRGLDSVFLREPTDGKWGAKIRSLLESGSGEIKPEEAFHLFTMDRRENVEKNILPALNQGKVVVLDRYYFSSIAYQGALGISPKKIKEENESFAPKPDLVLLLEISPTVGLERIKKGRNQKVTLYEKEQYLIKVKEIFDSMEDDCVKRIDASLPENQVNERIIQEFGEIM